jgi:hypothetical protein
MTIFIGILSSAECWHQGHNTPGIDADITYLDLATYTTEIYRGHGGEPKVDDLTRAGHLLERPAAFRRKGILLRCIVPANSFQAGTLAPIGRV